MFPAAVSTTATSSAPPVKSKGQSKRSPNAPPAIAHAEDDTSFS